MKKLIGIALIVLFCPIWSNAGDKVKVRGYTRRDGTYVAPHERSRPNAYKWDNRNYSPSQDPYNKSYGQPTKNYSPKWYQPNADRFLDDNPNNDYPPTGYIQQQPRDTSADLYQQLLERQAQQRREQLRQEVHQQLLEQRRQEQVQQRIMQQLSQPRRNNTGALIDPSTGKFLGNVNSNPYDPDSISNPYGRYGNKFSPDSVNNPYGRYGNRYSNDSTNNPYATNPPVLFSPPTYQPKSYFPAESELGDSDSDSYLGGFGLDDE